MLDQNIMNSLKGKSREERKAFFDAHKSELALDDLEAVNGGLAGSDVENPNSEVPDGRGNWISSMGFVCQGVRQC